MEIEKAEYKVEKAKFADIYGEKNDSYILKEVLFAQHIQIEKLEIQIGKLDKIRGNTNTLIWWLIAIPIIIGLFILFFGGCAALL